MKFLAFGILALLTFPCSAHAQDGAPRLRIIPSIGSYLPSGDLAYGEPGQDDAGAPDALNLRRGLSVGLAAEAPLRGVLALRAGVKYGFGSELVTQDPAGFQSCGANCTEVVYARTPLADASALLLSTDLVLAPAPSTWLLRPYLLGGLGYRRHFYDRDAVPAGHAAMEADEQGSGLVSHLGLGAEWPLRTFSLRVEADLFGDLDFDGVTPRGGRFADTFVSFGVSWTP